MIEQLRITGKQMSKEERVNIIEWFNKKGKGQIEKDEKHLSDTYSVWFGQMKAYYEFEKTLRPKK